MDFAYLKDRRPAAIFQAYRQAETFEKRSILLKAKEGENFNHRCPQEMPLG